MVLSANRSNECGRNFFRVQLIINRSVFFILVSPFLSFSATQQNPLMPAAMATFLANSAQASSAPGRVGGGIFPAAQMFPAQAPPLQASASSHTSYVPPSPECRANCEFPFRTPSEELKPLLQNSNFGARAREQTHNNYPLRLGHRSGAESDGSVKWFPSKTFDINFYCVHFLTVRPAENAQKWRIRWGDRARPFTANFQHWPKTNATHQPPLQVENIFRRKTLSYNLKTLICWTFSDLINSFFVKIIFSFPSKDPPWFPPCPHCWTTTRTRVCWRCIVGMAQFWMEAGREGIPETNCPGDRSMRAGN